MRPLVSLCIAVALAGPGFGQERDATKKKKKKAQPPFQWVNPLPEGHHETLRHATFRSPSLDVDVGYAILLPKDYESSRKRFPVVYYLHGGRPGNESKSQRLAEFLATAMNEGKVRPMIYVFVNGGPVSHYNMPDDPKAQGADVFIKELIPHVDATYRTVAKRSGRGIEGFSQGGRGTMRLSLRHPELFISAAAGGGGYATEKKISDSGGWESEKLRFAEGDNVWDLARRYAEHTRPKVHWLIYVGTKGSNYQNNLGYMKFLESLEIPFQKLIVPEAEHSAYQIYQASVLKIMRFHARHFREPTE